MPDFYFGSIIFELISFYFILSLFSLVTCFWLKQTRIKTNFYEDSMLLFFLFFFFHLHDHHCCWWVRMQFQWNQTRSKIKRIIHTRNLKYALECDSHKCFLFLLHNFITPKNTFIVSNWEAWKEYNQFLVVIQV